MQDTFRVLPVKPMEAVAQDNALIECTYLGENEEENAVRWRYLRLAEVTSKPYAESRA